MHTARYYKVLANNTVKCELCPHNCTLKDGQTGICRTRYNEKGTLFTSAYGNPCAVNIDPVEKKPLFHFLPEHKTLSIATAGCNFRCLNCQNASISQISPLESENYKILPEDVVKMALDKNCKSISYTYTEPTIFFEYMIDTAQLAHISGLKNIVVSNGYINQEPLKELIQYIDAFNIDLKSFDDYIYKKLNGGSLQPVLDTLITIRDSNAWLEITNLIVPTYNDSENMIENMTKWLVENGFSNFPLHFSKFYPTYKVTNLSSTKVSVINKAVEIALKNGMKYVYAGNVWGSTYENTYCPNCNNLIFKRMGYEIVEKNNLKDGKCVECGQIIPGVW